MLWKKGKIPGPEATKLSATVYSRAIHRWGETILNDGSALINIPQLTTETLDLVYRGQQMKTLRGWITAQKEHGGLRYNSAVSWWRLASFHTILPRTEGWKVDGKSVFREAWNEATFKNSWIFRWLENTLVPVLEKQVDAVLPFERQPRTMQCCLLHCQAKPL